MTVGFETRDRVAVLTLDNPPVNGLGLATRRALMDALVRAQQDAGIKAIVVTGGNGLFSGGADIREFNTPQALHEPNLHSLIRACEDSSKPVVAAVEGVTIGGGLELILGMHGRVADSSARIGLPEVKLGLLPGGGGTQRLPRAVGLEAALNMILSGEPRSARELADTRLLDSVVEGDVQQAAIELALQQAASGAPYPRVRDWQVEHENAEGFLAFTAATVSAAFPHLPAPLACVEAVRAAVLKPFDAGLAAEREGFMRLLNTPESAALRHAFFGERAAARIPGIAADTARRSIRRIGVIGAGTMGGGICMCFIDAGFPVTLIENSQEALDRGLQIIRANYASALRKGRISEATLEQRLALISPGLDCAALDDADLVIEAVYEEYTVKQSVFERIDAVAKSGAILASNTSTLDLDRIAGFTRRPADVVGLHFFSPANVMKLLEVVRGAATADDVLQTVMALAKKIRKVAVVSGVCDGFIGNRMIEQYFRQAGFLLDEGALPQQIDRAIERFGLPMGPFRMADLAGNDIGWAIRKRRYVEQPDMAYSKTADLVCELGRYGQKTGNGWYDYAPGQRDALPSPEVNALIEQHSRELGLTRRRIDDTEIVERLIYALVNEGALILQEGIAARASDIDVVYLYGYGFPPWRGGPMFHADSVGLYNVLAAMRRFATGYQGEAWQPAPLLLQLADDNRSFND